MSRHSIWLNFPLALMLAATAAAQGEDKAQQWLQNCDNNWNNDRARFCEVRNYSLRPTSRLMVDAVTTVASPSSAGTAMK